MKITGYQLRSLIESVLQEDEQPREIKGYKVVVTKGEHAGKTREFPPEKKRVARAWADKKDREYGGVCCTVQPIFESY